MSDEASELSGIDVTVPNAARMYNYYLGGKDNFAADRAAAEQVFKVAPETRELARQNRAFLRRALRHVMAESGVRQFLDIGTGLPTEGNVHEIVHTRHPRAAVAYVDNDPVVLAHARAILTRSPNTVAVRGDLRRPLELLGDPELRRLIDMSQPVVVLLVSVLHFLTEDDKPGAVIAQLRESMAPGSYLILSHVTAAERAQNAQQGADVYRNANASITLRSRQQIEEYFDGFDLLSPGLVKLSEWRPDEDAMFATYRGRELPTWFYCGVGRLK
ncbi:SAM-dependent methyltransferase [Acrocarpospora catenulata]|uniref:SAM-dependent methyltransferase n=1 Tax=Acrocarpospora catenulata TaxID=2836182 RepID=UPI001BDAB802|nr:SAM-dependent methyltransferase [Acrocarpospora catenulata]